MSFNKRYSSLGPRKSQDGYFWDIKLHIDFQRNNLKKKIDVYYDEILEDICRIEYECNQRALEIENLHKNLKGTKDSLESLLVKSNTCIVNGKRLNTIVDSTEKLKPMLDKKVDEFKKILLMASSFIFEPLRFNIKEIFDPNKVSFDVTYLITEVNIKLCYNFI